MTEKERASDIQVGGDHYKSMSIQPSEFCQRNQLNWCESNAIKYVCRHRSKNGRQDVEKAIHYLQLLLEWEYPFVTPERYAEIHTPLTTGEIAAIARPCSNCYDEKQCQGGLRLASGDCLHYWAKDDTKCSVCKRKSDCTGALAKGGCSLFEYAGEAK